VRQVLRKQAQKLEKWAARKLAADHSQAVARGGATAMTVSTATSPIMPQLATEMVGTPRRDSRSAINPEERNPAVNATDIARAHQSSGAVYSISKGEVNVRLNIDGVEIDPSDIKVVWFRRWAYTADVSVPRLFPDSSHRSDSNVFFACSHLFKELQAVTKFLISILSSSKWLSDPKNAAPNKLRVLKTASEAGLDVPDTIVTADADELRRFIKKHGAVISELIDRERVHLRRRDGAVADFVRLEHVLERGHFG
jgi:hypothetical protein